MTEIRLSWAGHIDQLEDDIAGTQKSPGFNHQHHINWTWYMPAIPDSAGRGKRTGSSRFIVISRPAQDK